MYTIKWESFSLHLIDKLFIRSYNSFSISPSLQLDIHSVKEQQLEVLQSMHTYQVQTMERAEGTSQDTSYTPTDGKKIE